MAESPIDWDNYEIPLNPHNPGETADSASEHCSKTGKGKSMSRPPDQRAAAIPKLGEAVDSVSTAGPDLPPLPCWFCGVATVHKPVEESFLGLNRKVKIPACWLCRCIYVEWSAGVAVLISMFWVAALVVIVYVHDDAITDASSLIMQVTDIGIFNKGLLALSFMGALILAAIAGAFVAWLAVLGFRLLMFFLRGASRADCDTYPEVEALVAAGYIRSVSLSGWVAQAAMAVASQFRR
jgi:hypothetical protein